MNGLIELTEDITVDGYDKNGDAYTFAGATPTEIITLNGVRSSVQGQFDELFNEASVIHAELDMCIKSGVTASEIACLSGVMTNIQTLCNDVIKPHGNTEWF